MPKIPLGGMAWRDTWLGAIMGALLFQGVSLAFGWSVAGFRNFNLVYGSLSALMAVLLWAYLSALVVVWGAQVCFTYSLVFGSRAGSLPELQHKLPGRKEWRSFSDALARVARRLSAPRKGRR